MTEISEDQARELLTDANKGTAPSPADVSRLVSLVDEWVKFYRPALAEAQDNPQHSRQVEILGRIQKDAQQLRQSLLDISDTEDDLTLSNLHGAYWRRAGRRARGSRRQEWLVSKMGVMEFAKWQSDTIGRVQYLEHLARYASAEAEKTKGASGGSKAKVAVAKTKSAFAREAADAFVKFTGAKPARIMRRKVDKGVVKQEAVGPWQAFLHALMDIVLKDSKGADNYARTAGKPYGLNPRP